LNDFPETVGDNNPNWRTPSFFRGVGLNHQPVMVKYPQIYGQNRGNMNGKMKDKPSVRGLLFKPQL